ncbi:MAG: ComF family protein [Marinilabiliaceae bacterium]|nr:ComF family protein [Marinilabiliaceae bacterium]
MVGSIYKLLHPLYDGLQTIVFDLRCKGCGEMLYSHEEAICMNCERLMSQTTTCQPGAQENVAEQRLSRLTHVESAFCAFNYGSERFNEGNITRTIVIEFKYGGNKKLAYLMGLKLGRLMLKTGYYNDCFAIVPVPVSRQRLSVRGYNQAEELAKGASEILDIPVRSDIIKRISNAASQTSRTHAERLTALKGGFELMVGANDLKGKSIILMDDVLTTGATLASCNEALSHIEDCKVNIATLAIAHI